MTFEQWLKKQNKRNDPVGDLSRDFIESNDPTCSKKILMERSACRGAFDALHQAIKEYRREKRK